MRDGQARVRRPRYDGQSPDLNPRQVQIPSVLPGAVIAPMTARDLPDHAPMKDDRFLALVCPDLCRYNPQWLGGAS